MRLVRFTHSRACRDRWPGRAGHDDYATMLLEIEAAGPCGETTNVSQPSPGD